MNKQTLWYKQAAEQWIDALPVGNGTLGGMVYGGLFEETIALNHDQLWSGFPPYHQYPNASTDYEEAQQLIIDGKLAECDRFLAQKMMARDCEAYMPLGNLRIKLLTHGQASNYKRWLDMSMAIAGVQYNVGDTTYTREVFVSPIHNVLAVKIKCSRINHLFFDITIDSLLKHEVTVKDDTITLNGICPSSMRREVPEKFEPNIYSTNPRQQGISFSCVIGCAVDTGYVYATEDKLSVADATEAVIYLSANTNFKAFNQPLDTSGKHITKTLDCVRKALDTPYAAVKSAHITEHKHYFDRLSLDLGGDNLSHVPTDVRLSLFQHDKRDIGMYTLLFDYGRYLLIASSRSGSQPTNLQGIWNDSIRPPWNCNYTTNINTEMNYWLAESCNLSEYHTPLFDMIEELSIAGKAVAEAFYNGSGWVTHHNSDIWRMTNTAHCVPVCAFWQMGSGWLCRHLFEHYEYTLDKNFLSEKAYPLMKGAAEFYLSILTEYDGYLMVLPTTSPENNYYLNGEHVSVSQTTTMTTAILKELFRNCLKSAQILGIDDQFTQTLAAVMPKLPPYKVGSKGQLLEWWDEMTESEPLHRHTSHMYPLHPAGEINPESAPELANACRQSLIGRGDSGTGWAIAWKINHWARLWDGDHALLIADNELTYVKDQGYAYVSGGGVYQNLMCAHPPFQIDGNFGYTAGIAEMFVQCVNDKIYLLPALPSRFTSGSINGICAKGGVTLNLAWENNTLTKAELIATADTTVTIQYKGTAKQFTLAKGEHAAF